LTGATTGIENQLSLKNLIAQQFGYFIHCQDAWRMQGLPPWRFKMPFQMAVQMRMNANLGTTYRPGITPFVH
jgi:hypothetical protein